MDIKADSTTLKEGSERIVTIPRTEPVDLLPSQHVARHLHLGHLPVFDILLTLGVTLAALIPRFLLALRLDVVTDEVVYILGGRVYFQYIQHGTKLWDYNYEHPPFVKLLIGLAISINHSFDPTFLHPFRELVAARLPSIIFGTLLVVAVFWLGRAIWGRGIAAIAALSLAVSPWLVYFSALAYLDMTMTALITVAFLLLWHAPRRPWLYPVIALLVGMAAASKYTAVLAIPGIILFTLYHVLLLRPRMPVEQRPKIPWLWWLTALLLAPIIFLAADPAIWASPASLLLHSFRFEWDHSYNGHLTFIAGQYNMHVPRWSILYIVAVKMSAFVTVPALLFLVLAAIQLVRFHLPRSKVDVTEATKLSFLFIWLLSILGMFSLLNIVVGTHYHLPMAAPVTLAGTVALAMILRPGVGWISTFVRSSKESKSQRQPASTEEIAVTTPVSTIAKVQAPGKLRRYGLQPASAILLVLLALLVVGPHFIGLVTTNAAEGYTSEFFGSENQALQVAYPAYREAVEWIEQHAKKPGTIGLAALPGTVYTGYSISWFRYNDDLLTPKGFTAREVHSNTQNLASYDYLVWPMHMVQRGLTIPPSLNAHVVHAIMGGDTIYCYILARDSATITP